MKEQTKIKRQEILEELKITNDTLALYEQELEIATNPLLDELQETYTEDEFNLIKMFHKLRSSGLTFNEIKLLTTMSEVLNATELGESSEIKKLLALSPIYRLKQALNFAKQELKELKIKTKDLEEALNKASEGNLHTNEIEFLKSELEAKQKTIDILDKRLKESYSSPQQVKGKKVKELYKTIQEKEEEASKLKKEKEELKSRLEETEEETEELKESLAQLESDFSEMEELVEEKYKEQIVSLRAQIETLVETKQKQWDKYYKDSNEQHRRELLTLQRKHEREIANLKERIRQQEEELRELRFARNPIMGFISRFRE